MRRKKEASKVKQTSKAKQHSTPKAVTFLEKNELPRVEHVHVDVHVRKMNKEGRKKEMKQGQTNNN